MNKYSSIFSRKLPALIIFLLIIKLNCSFPPETALLSGFMKAEVERDQVFPALSSIAFPFSTE